VKQLLLYLPVIHAGYEALLDRHPDASGVLLLGDSFADEFPVLRKEIRALRPDTAAAYVRSRGGTARVEVVQPDTIAEAVTGDPVVAPDEDLMHGVVQAYALKNVVFERTFLRWDRGWAQPQRPAEFDGATTTDAIAREMLGRAIVEAQRSSDWWRQVGAVAARDGRLLAMEHNQHRPTDYTPYIDGDPRNEFSRGVRIDLSSAAHAEAVLIAKAARSGTALAGADLYVSTFPCPPCARLIADAGFARCFFAGPYATLDGDALLRAAGVRIIWVEPAEN
jgi:dCMP deaminase